MPQGVPMLHRTDAKVTQGKYQVVGSPSLLPQKNHCVGFLQASKQRKPIAGIISRGALRLIESQKTGTWRLAAGRHSKENRGAGASLPQQSWEQVFQAARDFPHLGPGPGPCEAWPHSPALFLCRREK